MMTKKLFDLRGAPHSWTGAIRMTLPDSQFDRGCQGALPDSQFER